MFANDPYLNNLDIEGWCFRVFFVYEGKYRDRYMKDSPVSGEENTPHCCTWDSMFGWKR